MKYKLLYQCGWEINFDGHVIKSCDSRKIFYEVYIRKDLTSTPSTPSMDTSIF